MSGSNLSTNVTADITQLQAKLAIAREEVRAYGTEVRKTAQQLRSAGDDARAGLLQSLDQSVTKFRQAQAEAQQLRSKLEQIEPAAGHAAHGTAGVTRELIVLGHEALQGRFSRIPGSMMVLAERSGAATSAVGRIATAFTSTAGIAAIAGTAIIGTLALIALKAHETEEAVAQIGRRALLVGQDTQRAELAARGMLERLQQVGVGRGVAVGITSEMMKLTQATDAQRQALADMVPGMAKALGDEPQKAAEKLVEQLGHGATGVRELMDTYNLWDAATGLQQRQQLKLAEDTKNSSAAIDVAVHALQIRFQDYNKAVEAARGQQLNFFERGVSAAYGRVFGVRREPVELPKNEPQRAESPDQAAARNSQVTDAWQKYADAAAEAGNKAVEAAATAGKKRIDITQAEIRAERDVWQQAASDANLSEKQRSEAHVQAIRLSMQLTKDEATVGASSAKQALEAKIAALSAEQEANRENFSQMMALESQKLTLLRAAYGTNSRQYQEELKHQEELKRQHDTQVEAQELESINKQIAIDRQGLGERKSTLDAQVSDHLITKQAELTDLQQFAQQQYQIERQSLTDFIAMLHAGTAEYAKAMQDRNLLDAQHAREMAALNAQMHAADAADARRTISTYEQAFSQIGSAARSSVVGMIEGSTTWQQAESRVASAVLNSVVDLAGEAVGKWAVMELAKTTITDAGVAQRIAAEQASGASGLGTLIAAWLGFETTKTGTTVAQNAARLTDTATTNAAQTAATIAANVPAAQSYAAVGGAAAGASAAAIPVVGWTLAPGAASATYAELSAIGAMASFATGIDFVPYDMPAYIHRGEAVLNANEAATWRAGDQNTAHVSLNYAPQFHGAMPAGMRSQARAEAANFRTYLWDSFRNGQLRLPGR